MGAYSGRRGDRAGWLKGDGVPEAKHFWDKASEFEQLAKQTRNEILKQNYKIFAEEYRELAQYYETLKQRQG